MVICTLLEDVSVFRPRPFSLPFCYTLTQESGGIRRHLTVIRTSSFQDLKSDDTKRPIWSFAPFPEMAASSDRDYFSLTFCYPVTQEFGCMHRHLTVIRTTKFGDPKSDETWRPMWSSAPFSKTSASFARNHLVSPFAIQRPKSLVAYRDTLQLSASRPSETPSPMKRRD